jgi:hypothetical protein
VNAIKKEKTVEALAQYSRTLWVDVREVRFFIVAGRQEFSEGIGGQEFRPPAVGNDLLGLFNVKERTAARALKFVNLRAAQFALRTDLAVAPLVFFLFRTSPGRQKGPFLRNNRSKRPGKILPYTPLGVSFLLTGIVRPA